MGHEGKFKEFRGVRAGVAILTAQLTTHHEASISRWAPMRLSTARPAGCACKPAVASAAIGEYDWFNAEVEKIHRDFNHTYRYRCREDSFHTLLTYLLICLVVASSATSPIVLHYELEER